MIDTCTACTTTTHYSAASTCTCYSQSLAGLLRRVRNYRHNRETTHSVRSNCALAVMTLTSSSDAILSTGH